MKITYKQILCFLFLINYSLLFSQSTNNEFIESILELDKKLTNYTILKEDTLFYDSGEIEKIRYYNPLNKIRKSFKFYKTGMLKEIFSVNAEHQLDGILLELYDNGALKEYGIYSNSKGFSYYYYENGSIKRYYSSINSYPARYEVTFCNNGQKELEHFYDSLNYTQQGYYCDGSLKFKGVVINHKDEDGNFLKELPDGKWLFFHKNGKISKEIYFKNSKVLKTVKYDEEGVLYFEKEEKEPVEVLFHEGYVLGELGKIYN